MRRYLVVANQTLGGGHLVGKVRECLQDAPAASISLYLLPRPGITGPTRKARQWPLQGGGSRPRSTGSAS